jgi:mannose-1-phosphate guanylyltransferase/phosphomannomutase
MQAVVMAGGEGSRLRPLTLNRPKPMVPIANRYVMGHIVELLKRHNFSDIIATLQYRAEDIQNYFRDGSQFDVVMKYSIEPQPLGTAGSVKFAERHLSRQDPFLIISGDALTDFDLTQVYEFHKRVGAAVTITLCRVPNPLEYGVIIVDGQGRIERFLEKPSWSEVISDTVNTGIYVISPDVLDFIDPDKPFDFSKDLFPLLMQRGLPLYGYIADGYWCDVGNMSEYMRATGDLLEGKVNLGEIGQNIGNRIFVEEDVDIAPDAQLYGPIYLGRGTQIKGGVIIHGPTVIRSDTIVDNRARIEHSIIWRNAYIGEDVEIRGAIIARRCSLRRRATVFESAVIGDDCSIGAGAVIHPNVKLWPRKEVEAGATVKSSLIWGAQARRSLFGRYGVTGLVNIDITPEFAARVSAAFGSILPKGSIVTMNRDVHRGPRMIKRAMVSGLPSAGISVQDLESIPIPVARYYTAHTKDTSGGVHVRLSPYDQRTVDIRFFDKNGYNLGKAKERSIENIFFREDFRRVAFNELGRIDEVSDAPARLYHEAFLKALNVNAIRERKFNLVIDYANAPTALILPKIFEELGCQVISLNERAEETKMTLSNEEFQRGLDTVATIVTALKADLGVRVDVGGERAWFVDRRGNTLAGTVVAAALAELALRATDRNQPRVIGVMVNQPQLFERVAAQHGAQVRRTKIDPQAMMEAASDPQTLLVASGAGEFIVPSFHRLIDGMFPIAKLLELIATQNASLEQIVDALPPYFMAQDRVDCAFDDKGKVMRLLNEQHRDNLIDQIDGVKLRQGDGEWILIVPESDESILTLYAEAGSQDAAAQLVERFKRIIGGWITSGPTESNV